MSADFDNGSSGQPRSDPTHKICVPLNPDGPLPPVITSTLLGRTLDLGKVRVAGLVGNRRNTPGVSVRDRARVLLDQRAHRERLFRYVEGATSQDGSLLPRMLLRYVSQKHPRGQQVLQAIVKPALAVRTAKQSKVVDSALLSAAIAKADEVLLEELSDSRPGRAGEALAVLLISYTWLFPDAAAAAFSVAVERWPELGSALGVDQEGCREFLKSYSGERADGPTPADENVETSPATRAEEGTSEQASSTRHQVNAVPVPPGHQPTTGPHQSEINSIGRDGGPPAILGAHVRALAREVGELSEQIVSFSQQGRYGEIAAVAAQATGTANALETCLVELETAFEVSHRLPRPQIGSVNDAERYLGSLASEVSRLRESDKEKLETLRGEAVARFEAAGLELPIEFQDARTLAELRSTETRFAPVLAEANLSAQLARSRTISLALLDAVPNERRLELYIRHSATAGLRHLLAWLKSDHAAWEAQTNRAFEALVGLVPEALAAGEPLPPGLWTFLHDRDEERLLRELCSGVLPKLLAATDERTAAIPELAALLPESSDLDPDIVVPIRLVQSESLPPDARARELARIAQVAPGHERVAIRLVDALAAAERYADLWLVGDAYARVGIAVQHLDSWRESMLTLFVERACDPSAPMATLMQFVDWESWAIGSDGLTVLLFLVAVRGGSRADILYKHARRLDELRDYRPKLLDLWLRRSVEGSTPPAIDVALKASWEQGHLALKAWDQHIQKRSCYQAWGYAEEYQRHLRAYLERAMDIVSGNGSPPELDSRELVEALGSQHRLPPVAQPALGNMCAFMDEQIERLIQVTRARDVTGASLQELRAHVRPPFRSRLQAEAAAPGNQSPAMRRIYAHVLEQLDE